MPTSLGAAGRADRRRPARRGRCRCGGRRAPDRAGARRSRRRGRSAVPGPAGALGQVAGVERPDVTAPPHLLEHDPAWPSVAARRCRALRAALGALDPADRLGLQRVDHVGSTAAPGLAAKPFLDLQVTLDRLPGSAALASARAPLGWAPAVGARPNSPGVHRDMRSRQDTADDDAFNKRLLAPDPVHPGILHVRQTASPFARRVVRFRDQLRADTPPAATTSGQAPHRGRPCRRSGLRRLHPRQGGVAGRRPSTRRRLGGWRRRPRPLDR